MAVQDVRGAPRALLSAAWLTLGFCFAAAVVDGYDVVSIGLAAPRMAPALGIARTELGPIFSAATFGLLAGSALVGPLADRIGRKPCLIASLVVFGLFSLATPLCRSFEALVVVRSCAGLGFGASMPTLIALASEQASPEARVRNVVLMAAG